MTDTIGLICAIIDTRRSLLACGRQCRVLSRLQNIRPCTNGADKRESYCSSVAVIRDELDGKYSAPCARIKVARRTSYNSIRCLK